MKSNLLLIFFALAGPVSAQKSVKAPSNFIFIPMGEAKLESQMVAVDAFFMQSHEVTVGQYSEFLSQLKEQNKNLYKDCYPDTAKWVSLFTYSYNQPFVEHYHKHPSYYSYPMNNISREAAQEYCRWYTQHYNSSKEAMKRGKGVFRLPTQAEWVRAARGDNHNWIFAWEGPYLKDKDCVKLANFLSVNDANISRNAEGEVIVITPMQNTGAKQFITSPVKQFKSNLYKLFDMCGNVAEMVSDCESVRGGSWYDTGYELRVDAPGDHLPVPSPMVGFRMVFVPSTGE
ncbi:MAG: SUMF1/EgtB/PvdO family nonheme iron enzyme [Tenuifilaceae bacterium]|jgi:formylglycine-generating enzyme required for sulfatase activity|nr:SUMF1/EgtB/PvdO family nonheme iron enzyme [Tenuifilaceae bacterium]